jgi:hypothetical protein
LEEKGRTVVLLWFLCLVNSIYLGEALLASLIVFNGRAYTFKKNIILKNEKDRGISYDNFPQFVKSTVLRNFFPWHENDFSLKTEWETL